jgi:uncharacterized protein YndB with AHSA1/START domain
MEKDTKAEATLVLKRTVSAPPSQVFKAWTSPEQMRHWFCPEDGFSVAIAEVDLRIGGSFRIGMKNPKNQLHIATGTYREIQQPERLVFTWSWEHDPIETVVTLSFTDVGNATELVLKHELLQTVKRRDDHARGWNGCLQHLEAFLLRYKQ